MEKDIPYATDLDFVTDKFWFKLKKGFGNNDDKPKSFEIITKAQIILSSLISNTVQEKFVALNEEYKKGNITKEEAVSLNYELRESALKPEEINELNVSESIIFINEFSFEEHIRERELLKQKVQEGFNAITELKRRDYVDRGKKTKKVKFVFRAISSAIRFGLILIVVSLFYIGYLTINYLKEPGDSKIQILGLILGLIAMIPIYKYFKKMLAHLKRRIIKKFQTEILSEKG